MKTKAFTPQWCSALSRPLLLFLFAFTLALPVLGQHSEIGSPESKYFIGIGLNNTQYPIMGEPKHESFSTIIPMVNVNVGYQLNKRTTIQIGVGYGANEINGVGTGSLRDGELGMSYRYQHIRGIVTPLTLKWTPFNTYKRLQLYANASLAPIFGHMKARATDVYGEDVILLYDDKFYTFDLSATVGLTLNYKINKRFEGYIDGILMNKNLYFQRPTTSFFTQQASIGIGLNYRLK